MGPSPFIHLFLWFLSALRWVDFGSHSHSPYNILRGIKPQGQGLNPQNNEPKWILPDVISVMVMNRKAPEWRYWYSLLFYFHPWLNERGRKMQLYCCFNRSVVLKHVLRKDDIHTRFYFKDFPWEYGLIPLVIYWNMSFVVRNEGGSAS